MVVFNEKNAIIKSRVRVDVLTDDVISKPPEMIATCYCIGQKNVAFQSRCFTISEVLVDRSVPWQRLKIHYFKSMGLDAQDRRWVVAGHGNGSADTAIKWTALLVAIKYILWRMGATGIRFITDSMAFCTTSVAMDTTVISSFTCCISATSPIDILHQQLPSNRYNSTYYKF